MRRVALLVAMAAVGACSSLPDAGNGIVELQLFPPDSLFVYVGDSVKLHAVALDIHGDSIPAVIVWQTPDTASARLDSLTSGWWLVGTAPGSARVQATAGTLRSDAVLSFAVRADTVITSIRQRP